MFVLISACEPDMDLNTFEPEIVIEGVVENGEFPTVLISQLIPVDMSLDSAKVSSIPIRWGKVTISDGTTEEILVGMRSPNRLFQYEYSAYHMRGEIGKTYTMKAEYSGRILTAQTTIPTVPELNNIQVSKLENSDSLYSIKASVIDNPAEKNYYLISVKQNKASDVFRPCFLGAIDDADLQTNSSVEILNSIRIVKNYSLYFKSKQSYVLKFSQIGRLEYAFWKDYFNQILGSANPIFPNVKSLSSNINGGLGVFYGCASKNYIVNVP